MKRAGLVIVIIVALLALACGFGASTAALYVTQPSSNSTATMHFVVNKGDSTAAVADNLQKAGIIRNAQLFRLWARYRHKDSGIEYGVYDLRPNMTMDQILDELQKSTPDERLAGVPDGLRVTQYAAYFAKDLPNFNGDNFLKIAKTGVEPDKTNLWDKYWYVQKPGAGVVYALEGYLYPEHYYFQPDANETVVVERMLDQLGELLCPGPNDNPTAYIHDKDQCVAHATTIGDSNTNIFTVMEHTYFTNDPVQALHDTLNVAGLTIREILNYSDALNVATVYHNRFLADKGKVDSDTAGYMGSDPSAEYARDTDNPPKDGKWWADFVNQAAKDVDPKSPYNTEAPNHQGLPPSAIANAPWDIIKAAASPLDVGKWPYFYFVSDKCGNVHYAKTAGADFDSIVAKYITQQQCSKSVN